MATGAVVGAGMLANTAMQWYGAQSQASAARSAAEQQRQLGEQAAQIIREAEPQARQELMRGEEQHQAGLSMQAALLGRGQTDVGRTTARLDERFAGARQLGADAEQRLRDVLLGGDMSALQMDPGYQFRQEEGNKAIERAAAAAGSFGSGSNLKDYARFNQGLASQEYGNAIARLMGLQGVGAQATSQSAALGMQGQSLQSQLLGAQASTLGQQGAVAGALGQNLSALTTGTAANVANAMTGAGAQAIQYDLAGAQANAQALANIGNAAQQASMMYMLYGGQPSQPAAYQPSPFREAGSIRTVTRPTFEYGNPLEFPSPYNSPTPYPIAASDYAPRP